MSDPWSEKKIKRALDLKAQGATYDEIGEEFGLKGETVRRALIRAGVVRDSGCALQEQPTPPAITVLNQCLSERARRPPHRRDPDATGAFISRAIRAALKIGHEPAANNLIGLSALWLRSGGKTFADFDLPYEVRAMDVIDNRDGGRLNWSTNPFAVRRSSALGDVAGGSII